VTSQGKIGRPIPLEDTKPLRIAVLAMGGQGGGVLVDWIVALAEAQNWYAQSTSVPGVAQRTGATIYYIEMLKKPADGATGTPVFALMPAPGEVDVVASAELMEAGRAIQRGLVSADKTILITSSHRALAVQEKAMPGDGTGDADKVYDAALAHARRFLAFDMQVLAEESGSVISAVLFGALAASAALPFEREQFEAAIKTSERGAAASLKAFAAGYRQAAAELAAVTPPMPPRKPTALKSFPTLAETGYPGFDALLADARQFPDSVHGMLAAGLRASVDFQDIAYGRDYLDRLFEFLALEPPPQPAGDNYRLTRTAAKQIAVAMTYHDVIFVADRKIRASRFDRVKKEVQVTPDQILYLTEFMHPRMAEVCDTLPAGLGAWIMARPRVFGALDRIVSRGRRVRTGTIFWFSVLYALAGLRRFRRGSLRHRKEMQHMTTWLTQVKAMVPHNYDLACEMLDNRRLIKGYSDTHSRGANKFDIVMAAAERLASRPDGADWVRRLRQAALSDEDGRALSATLKTIESLD
jgi:indolepyruvate ferredoxin oxidoreductase beta subunit